MNKIIRKIIIQTFTLFLAFTIIFISVNAQTLSDIDQQIKIAKEQKAAREAELNQAQTLLKTLQNKSYSVSTDINTLKSQITDLENQTSQVKNQISELEKNIKKTQDDMDLFKAQRNEQISQYFMDSSMDSTIEDLLNSASSIGEYQTLSEIKTFSIGNKKQQLDEVSENFVKLNEEKKQVEQLKADLELQNSSLAQKKQELETALYSINNNIGSTTANANSIKSQLSGLNSSLGQLDSQRKDLLNAELQKMANNQQTTQVPLQDGQYFFMGRGRDLYDGHGLGMSQWGAYNMAQLGYTWDKILTYYYQNTTIGNYSEPAMIVVDGKTGPITFDDYLAGIGEVPDYWPDESIKAQVVAARTYAMRSAAIGSDGYSHICGTDSCQVFRGTSAKSCTADNLANFPSQVGAKCKETLATKGKVILNNGSPITAYYSANHRGCSSSLSTVWGNPNSSNRDGINKPFIQSVKDIDDSFSKGFMVNNAYNPSQLVDSTNWRWRTNGYTLEQLSNILSRSPLTSVGTLQQINTTMDRCGRVATITLIGSAGSKNVNGWDFRAIFNDITPYNDYVYSTEFTFEKK